MQKLFKCSISRMKCKNCFKNAVNAEEDLEEEDLEKEQKFNILRGIVISSHLETEQKTELIEFVNQLEKETEGWLDVDIEVPVDDKYILLSFSNFSVPVIGRYEEDENGGAFYIGDEDESCLSQDMFVNAWMPLPKCYEE